MAYENVKKGDIPIRQKMKPYFVFHYLMRNTDENHIAKTLTELGYSIYYYQSEGKAEVNFVIQDRMGTIIPIETEVTFAPQKQDKCAYCHALLFEEDDVVYCPECGAPHHRDCYNQLGECANKANHREHGENIHRYKLSARVNKIA